MAILQQHAGSTSTNCAVGERGRVHVPSSREASILVPAIVESILGGNFFYFFFVWVGMSDKTSNGRNTYLLIYLLFGEW